MSLFDNPLATMYGPFFLLLYFLLALLAFLFVRFRLADRISRRSEGGPTTVIPDRPDPYELAYLRGGTRNVMALVIYTLIRRRWLAATKIKGSVADFGVKRRELVPSQEALTEMETPVYGHIPKNGITLSDILNDKTLFQRFSNSISDSYPQRVAHQQLIWTKPEFQRFRNTKLWIIAGLILLALYKLYAAHLHGRSNVGFLLTLALLSVVIIYHTNVRPPLSAKGEAYLAQHKQVFQSVPGKQLLTEPLYRQQLMIALYGFGVLAFTTYDYFGNYMNAVIIGETLSGGGGGSGHSFDSWSSSSSCSGNSSCGGSCGGGCGGCGGSD